MRLIIEYCEECLFLGRALEVVKAVLERFSRDLAAVELRPGHGGVFTVALDGEVLFTIGEDGRPPAPEEIVRRLEPKLRQAA